MNDLFAAAESDALRRAPQEASAPEGSCPELPIAGTLSNCIAAVTRTAANAVRSRVPRAPASAACPSTDFDPLASP